VETSVGMCLYPYLSGGSSAGQRVGCVKRARAFARPKISAAYLSRTIFYLRPLCAFFFSRLPSTFYVFPF